MVGGAGLWLLLGCFWLPLIVRPQLWCIRLWYQASTRSEPSS